MKLEHYLNEALRKHADKVSDPLQHVEVKKISHAKMAFILDLMAAIDNGTVTLNE